MSQLIVCRNSEGIVLAADSKAWSIDAGGQLAEARADRLIRLGDNSAILAGGAVEGVAMCEALRNFISEEGLVDVEEIYSAALAFLSGEYDRFMRKVCENIPVDPLHQMYFVLVGRDGSGAGRIYMLWTKKRLPQLDGDEITRAYAAPRRMGLEYKLNELSRRDAPLDEIVAAVKKGMESVAGEEEVGGPFVYATVTADGLKLV